MDLFSNTISLLATNRPALESTIYLQSIDTKAPN
jgi:hypothetical protein